MDQPSAPPPSTLGSFLKQVRTRANLSLTDLSEISGIPRNTIHRLEQDEVNNPSIIVLCTLATILEFKILDILAFFGINPAAQLPDLPHYLQIKYPHLSAAALAETQRRLEEVLHHDKYIDTDQP